MNPLRLLLLCLALLWPGLANAQGMTRNIDSRLIAETDSPAPGETVTLALVMTPKPGWHGYWKNPGDAGAETRIAWRLPAGVQAGPLQYPVPERLTVQGIMNYVYEAEYAQLIALRLPAGIAAGTRLPLRGTADYLACTDKICVPEQAEIALDIVVGARGTPLTRQAQFDGYRQAMPRPLGTPARFETANGRLRLGVPIPANLPIDHPYFFPLTERAIDHSAPQQVSRNGDFLIVETALPKGAADIAAIEGVLKIGDHVGLSVQASPGAVPAAGTPLAGEAPAGQAPQIALALLGAILGGLLLNIMPCVFPILSLKALSLARAGEGEREARREGLAYTAGVVIVCVALGAALLALRAGGEMVGWAFQLQDPRVILFLFLLVLAIALNLAGLFELPALGGGTRLAGRGGTAGAFWTGALAAFVATPCTGPFMGAALGAALVLPTGAALAIFAGLGLGLALPFLLLGFVPALRRRLPKPGPWMLRFRRILSVPMFLTALALAWVLSQQTGTEGLVVAIAAAAAVALLLWWAGRRHAWLPLAPAGAAMLAAILLVPAASAPAAGAKDLLNGEPFSENRLAALRGEGRPVFVYFTADWCVTCKVNESAVLSRGDVAEAFAAKGVAVLIGDWTTGDAAIGRFLQSQGRSGVPLYLYYAAGKDGEILPQILTPGRLTSLAGA